MHKVSSILLRPGMIVAQGLYHTNGLFLLTRGTVLTESYIQKIKALGISSLYITSSDIELNLLPPEDVIQEKTRIRAIKDIYSVFNDYQTKKRVDSDLLKDSVSSILRDLSSTKKKLVQISDIRLHDNYTYAHSVNVSVLATIIGKQLHYPHRKLSELTLGALLHDIGKTQIPSTILNKPTRLSFEEEEIVRDHCEGGFNILYKTNQFSSQMMRVALEHHEKYDGSGYPRHLTKTDIHEYARIVAIADVYDALTSERAYKKPYLPYLAHNIMVKCTSGHFDPEILKIFFNNIALYPIGCILKISGGYAIVKEVRQNETLFPTIVHFADAYKQLLAAPRIISLAKNRDEEIEYEVDEYETVDLIKSINLDPARYLLP